MSDPAEFRAGDSRYAIRALGGEDPDRAEGFLQSAAWGAFKRATGWKSNRFRIEAAPHPAGRGAGVFTLDLLVLERALKAGFSFAYLPHGPERLPEGVGAGEFLEALGRALKPFFGPRCLFLRFDLPWYAPEPGRESETGYVGETPMPDRRTLIAGSHLKIAPDVQPPDTVLLDLRAAEEEILAGMKPKWRYNIRLAEKKGVTATESGREAIEEFHALYRTTAARDRIAIHPRSYYEALFDSTRGSDARVSVWTARHEGRAIAAIITLMRGSRAVYLYGASSDEKRALMPAYALQWAAIRAARDRGCAEYDFFGIPPGDDPSHPMAGLYRFKTGFGGLIAHRTGCVDVPYAPIGRALFAAAERARLFWHKRVLKFSLRRKQAPRTR